MVKTEIVNVVATASLDQGIPLDVLSKFPEILYNSEVYGGRVAYFKTNRMEGKVSIFSSGKMISVGTKSEKQAFKELEQAKKFLIEKELAKPVQLDCKTRNIVVLANLEGVLNLETLSENTKAIYEPEQFPGAILRIKTPHKSSILLFASGKAVITALQSESQIEPTVRRLQELVKSNQ
jgi:transcription initiation factor TFIID TATA-box-binding protein